MLISRKNNADGEKGLNCGIIGEKVQQFIQSFRIELSAK
jgi:hypothetical protein